MSIAKFINRFFSSANVKAHAIMEEADQKIDIQQHASYLLAQQKENEIKVTKSRNALIKQQQTLLKTIETKQHRLDLIEKIVIADQDKPKREKTTDYTQKFLTAIHEGPLLQQSINSMKLNLEAVNSAIDKTIEDLGKIERNTITIESRLETLKTKDTLATIKSATYTITEANHYFSIEKLEAIVETKEVEANTSEKIFEMDSPLSLESEVTSNDFIKSVLAKNSKKD